MADCEAPQVFARLNAEMASPQVNLPARCNERGAADRKTARCLLSSDGLSLFDVV